MPLPLRLLPLLAVASAGLLACAHPADPIDEPAVVEDVHFANGAVALRGWLALPAGDAPHAAVVLVGGNGPWRPAHFYFQYLVDAFGAAGVAVLYYDHRGEGESTGQWEDGSFEDLADDALAAVRLLRAHPRIDAARVGIWGHSMGGWIAPLAASRSADVAFVITAAGPGVAPLEQTLHHHANLDRQAGIPEEHVVEMRAFRRALFVYYTYPTQANYEAAQAALDAAQSRPWRHAPTLDDILRGITTAMPTPATMAGLEPTFRGLRRDQVYDPAPALASVHVPMLALFGEADPVVPLAASVAAMQAGFAASGNAGLTVRTFPAADHLLRVNPGGDAAGLAPGYLDTMTAWVLANTR